MTVSRKIKILVITIAVCIAVLATAFLVPVSFSAWVGGTTTTEGDVQTGYWGVIVEFPDDDQASSVFLNRNANVSNNVENVTYNGSISVAKNTRIQIRVNGAHINSFPYTASDNNTQNNGKVSQQQDENGEHFYILLVEGIYRIIYVESSKKLSIGYIVEDNIKNLFENGGPESDDAFKKMLSDNGLHSDIGSGVKGIVTPSGAIVEIVRDGNALRWDAVLELKAGDKIALFGKPFLSGSSVKISQYDSSVPNEKRALLVLLDTGYFEATQNGVYAITITGGAFDFSVSDVNVTPTA